MNSRAKRRLGVATGVIIIVLLVVLAVVGGNSAARTVSVAEARTIASDAKIQVTGNVVENSFSIDGDVLSFSVYDPDADPAASETLPVRYDGGVSATFGNDVTAICTGRMDAEGRLNCLELVTKCPSKYENATGALSIAELLDYGEKVIGKPVKVSGRVSGAPASIEAAERFVLADAAAGAGAAAGVGAGSDAGAGSGAADVGSEVGAASGPDTASSAGAAAASSSASASAPVSVSASDSASGSASASGSGAGSGEVNAEGAVRGLAIPVKYVGALPDEVVDGAAVVLTGSLGADGAFTATDVALEG